jgi:two-component system LytT family response regulator
MMKVVLVDDEKEGLDVLAYDLVKLEMDLDITGQFTDPAEALAFLKREPPDLLFLDIEMPWMSGFELLDKLEDIPFEVIFVTAYDQYAIRAFRYYAIDYLLKPVTREQLGEAISRVIANPRKGSDPLHIRALVEKLNSVHETFTKFVVPTVEGYELINIDDIIRCQADSNYVEIYLVDGSITVMSRSLKYVQALLEDHDFFRAHQSHLVNMRHVSKYLKSGPGQIMMRDNSVVSLSRDKKEAFLKRIGK